jgi:hypothetical protein
MPRVQKARFVSTCLTLVGAATTIGALGYGASPAQADTSTGSTTANVEVTSSISLTNLTPSFTLAGPPGSVPTTGANPVTMTVTTNNFAGYNVTVVPHSGILTGAIPGNTDSISSNALEVDGPAQGGAYVHLTFGTPTVVATKASVSAPTGDPIINNYRITVPAVRPDTYSGVLDYVATTL